MTTPTYSLPLNDQDRAVLRLHAASIGKSPAQSDEALVAIYYGNPPKAETSGTPSTVTAEQVAEQLRKPVTERLVEAARDKVLEVAEQGKEAAIKAAEKAAREVAEKHRVVRIEIRQGENIRTLPNAHRHAVFTDVLSCLSVRENVYLIGGAGSGKTTVASQVAEAMGLPFYSTGAVGMAYQLQGFINAEGKYMETDLYRAYTGGGIFLFDEIDASSAQALLAFNAIAANDLAAFPCGTVKRHDDFVIIASANTFGNGADAQYVGRAQLDAATLDRFAFITMDYDEALEMAISPCEEWTRYVQAVRAKVSEHKMRHVVSPRASIRGGKLLLQGMDAKRVAELVVFKSMTDADRAKLPKVPTIKVRSV
jgi:MoxR-like ATPase